MLYHLHIFRIAVLTECCLPLVSIQYCVINMVAEKTYFFFISTWCLESSWYLIWKQTQNPEKCLISREDMISLLRAWGTVPQMLIAWVVHNSPILFIQHFTCSKRYKISATTTLLWGCKYYPLNIRVQMTCSWSKETLCSRTIIIWIW